MPEEPTSGSDGEAPCGARDHGNPAVGARFAGLLPRRWRQRFFEPAYEDLLAERLPAILLEARAFLLLLETIRVGVWQRLREPRNPPPTPPPGRSRRRSRFALETRMDTLRQDLRQAVRMLARRPTVALVVVVTLTLGIGMNTAVFSVLYGVLYQPLPYADPDRLVRVGRQPEARRALNPLSPAEYRDLRPRVRQV